MTPTFSHRRRRRVASAAVAAALVAGACVATVALTAPDRAGPPAAEAAACCPLAEGDREAATAAAQSPGDSSDDGAGDTRRDREGRRGGMPPFDFGWGGYGRYGNSGNLAPRPHEWAEVQLFMHEHSPRRQAALEELPEGERKESLKRYVFTRYRNLQALRKRDPAAYEQRLTQLAVEDQIFALVSDWGGAPDDVAAE